MKALLNKLLTGRPSLRYLLVLLGLHCPCSIAVCVAQTPSKLPPKRPAIIKKIDQIPAQIAENSVGIYNNTLKPLTISVVNNLKTEYKETLDEHKKSYVSVSQQGAGPVVFMFEVPGMPKFTCALEKGKYYQVYSKQGKLTAAKVIGL